MVNLAGGANIPFHAWVHEGRSGCGETPDSGENLQFQYKTAAGGWTVFQTFSGGGSQTSNFQFMTTLPAAAIHANSQFRIHQTSGSSTCCDYWFVDDIRIATPPESNWTSPTMGHKVGSTQTLAADTYAPLSIEADIPNGAFLNWSVLNTAGEVIPACRVPTTSSFRSIFSTTISWTSSAFTLNSKAASRASLRCTPSLAMAPTEKPSSPTQPPVAGR